MEVMQAGRDAAGRGDQEVRQFTQTLAGLAHNIAEQGLYHESDHWLLGNRVFIVLMNILIVASAAQMGLTAQVETAFWSDYSQVVEHAFTAIFALEMVVKVSILRVHYFREPHVGAWNTLDFCVAWTAILDMWVMPYVFVGDGTNYSVVKVFRMLRLCRVLRLVHNVPELFLVIEGMIASLRSMGWILLLLSCFIFMFAICCVEVVGRADSSVYPSFDAEAKSLYEFEIGDFNNYLHFGTLFRALMTIFSLVLLAEWDSIVRPVTTAQPAMVIIFLLLVALTSFGFFNVIIGVIVERTTDAMTRARAESIIVKNENKVNMARDIANILFELDDDQNGLISYHELERAEHNVQFQNLMAGMDLPLGFSFHDLFSMLDHDSSHHLSKKEFVLGLHRLIDSSDFQRQCITNLLISELRHEVKEASLEIRRSVKTEFEHLRQQFHLPPGAPMEPELLKPKPAAGEQTAYVLSAEVADASRLAAREVLEADVPAFGSHAWEPQAQSSMGSTRSVSRGTDEQVAAAAPFSPGGDLFGVCVDGGPLHETLAAIEEKSCNMLRSKLEGSACSAAREAA